MAVAGNLGGRVSRPRAASRRNIAGKEAETAGMDRRRRPRTQAVCEGENAGRQIARKLKRTEGATRQKALTLNVSFPNEMLRGNIGPFLSGQKCPTKRPNISSNKTNCSRSNSVEMLANF